MSGTANHILLIAHAPLAQALRDCAVHVFADCVSDISVLDVPPDEAPETTLATARALLAQSGAERTLVLADVLGTPAGGRHGGLSAGGCEPAHAAARHLLPP